jgi:hypothetical protein
MLCLLETSRDLRMFPAVGNLVEGLSLEMLLRLLFTIPTTAAATINYRYYYCCYYYYYYYYY